ncbi:MAG: hypothetical protein ACXVJ7_02155 [Acidimicrobiia bacterium]
MNPAVFVVTRVWAALFVLGGMVLVLLLARAVVGFRPAEDAPPAVRRRRGLGGLVIGKDGRASTSKVQAVLWTFAVFFAIGFLLIWGRSSGCDAATSKRGECREAAQGRATFDRFVDHGIQAEFFVLMGFPVGVAIAAKAITQAQVDDHPDSKPPVSDTRARGIRQSLQEIASNDEGEFDLLDFQYFAFNLLTLTFFFVQFLTDPGKGLPDLPATLIALSGVAAAGYTSKKGLIAAGTTTPEAEGA